MRLDVYMAENALCRSRSMAAELIKKGMVSVNGNPVTKPSFLLTESDAVLLTAGPEFVSRGGYKLKKALRVFQIDLKDKICLDLGASTGGFTDCMLQNGAQKVFAVDVGSGQLVSELQSDPRVVNMENTNLRDLTRQTIETVDFIGCDVSFISLYHVFPVICRLLPPCGDAVCLVKPQFEAGKENVGKKGVVKSPFIHEQVLHRVIELARQNELSPTALDYSPIKGGDGNIEYLLHLTRDTSRCGELNIAKIVADSHLDFGE